MSVQVNVRKAGLYRLAALFMKGEEYTDLST
jgi:hypothetical protein